MLRLELNHGNVERFIEQVIEEPEFYMGENYNKYKDQIDFDSQFIFIESSCVYRAANADMTAIPLKDGSYYMEADSFAPLDNGSIVSEEEVLKFLKEVKEEYSRREYDYYYEGHLL